MFKESYVKKTRYFSSLDTRSICRMTFCFEVDIRNNYISLVVKIRIKHF